MDAANNERLRQIMARFDQRPGTFTGTTKKESRYVSQGSVEQWPELHAISMALFSVAPGRTIAFPDGRTATIQSFANGQCAAIDLDSLRYVTQNPTKTSWYAEQARGGAKIIWIIRTHDQQGNRLEPNEWLGRIQNGEVFTKRESQRAY